MNKIFRTDMACELIQGKHELKDDIKKTEIYIDEKLSKKFNRPKGTYITIDTVAALKVKRNYYELVSKEVATAIKKLINPKNVLVIGLGNPRMSSDALGNLVCRKLFITRGIPVGYKTNSLCAFSPNVVGVTGIESFDIVKNLVNSINPDVVILVDSLASSSLERLGTSFQICSTGIVPGSGVKNDKKRLDKSSLGVEVISIGVPLVVYATTILYEMLDGNVKKDVINKYVDLVVTPRDIDMLADECATIIATGINLAVHDNLSYKDVLQNLN